MLLKCMHMAMISSTWQHLKIMHMRIHLYQCFVLMHKNTLYIWRLLYVVLFTLHILAFFEYPSSLTVTSDIRYREPRVEVPCGVTEAIEILCLLILVSDLVCKVSVPVSCFLWVLVLPCTSMSAFWGILQFSRTKMGRKFWNRLSEPKKKEP